MRPWTVAVVLLGLVALPASSLGDRPDEPSVGREASAPAAEPGPPSEESCVVCGRPAEPAAAREHRGVRVPLCGACGDEYSARPERYHARLQPRAALFQDDYAARQPVTWLAFAAGLYALLGLLCGGLAGSLAVRRGQPPWRYVLAGVLGLALGPLWAALQPSRPAPLGSLGLKQASTRAPAACPGCGAGNHPAARRCSCCGTALEPSVGSELGSSGQGVD